MLDFFKDIFTKPISDEDLYSFLSIYIGISFVIWWIVWLLRRDKEKIKKLSPKQQNRLQTVSIILSLLPFSIVALAPFYVVISAIMTTIEGNDGGGIDTRGYRGEYDGVEYYDLEDSNTDYYYNESPGVHWVDPYERSDGTQVEGHWRSNPDDSIYNNLNP